MRKRRVLVGVGVLLALAGCGSPVTMTNSSPTGYVSQTAQYTYQLTITPAGDNCINTDFRLTSDVGNTDDGIAAGTGILYLVPGYWTGTDGYGTGTGTFINETCNWTLTLTP